MHDKTRLLPYLAQLRHAYSHLMAERVVNQKRFAKGLLGPVIVVLEEYLEDYEDMNKAWEDFKGDFNSMTDEEIEYEVRVSQQMIDEHEAWLEAVASWKAAGKPRKSNVPD